MNESVVSAFRDVCYDIASDEEFQTEFKNLWIAGRLEDVVDMNIVTSTKSAVAMTMCEMMAEYFANAPEDDARGLAHRALQIAHFDIDLNNPKKFLNYVNSNTDEHVPYVILASWADTLPYDFDKLAELRRAMTPQEAEERLSELTGISPGWIDSMAKRMARKLKPGDDNVPRAFMSFYKGSPDLDISFQDAAAQLYKVYMIDALAEAARNGLKRDEAQNYVRSSISSIPKETIATACTWAYILAGTVAGNRKFVKEALKGRVLHDGQCTAEKLRESDRKAAELQKEIASMKKQMARSERLAKKREDELKEKAKSMSKPDPRVHELMEALEKEKKKNASLEKKIAEYKEFENDIAQEEEIPEHLPDVDTSARYMFVMQDAKMKPKLHEWFPNSVLSEGKEVTKGYYMVVFITRSISHSEYIRVKRRCEAMDVPYVNCNRVSRDAVMEAIAARTTRAPFA